MTVVRRRTWSGVILSLAVALALSWAAPATAGTDDGEESFIEEAIPEAAEDKTARTPSNYQRAFSLANVYEDLPGGGYNNTTRVQYSVPFDKGRAQSRFRLPVVWNKSGEKSEFGLGDIEAKVFYIQSIGTQDAFVLALDTTWDTATGDSLGKGTNTIAPEFIYEVRLPGGRSFSTGYTHRITFGGEGHEGRPDTHSGTFEWTHVDLSDDKMKWVEVNPQVLIDYGSDNRVSAAFELEWGWVLPSNKTAAPSVSVRPGVGIGQYRPYDWSLEVGYQVVGF